MRLHIFAVSCLAACGLFWLGADARYINKRNAEETEKICSKSTPCAWEVYTPYTRDFVSFIRSPCECPQDSTCVRTGDDISISAYVHRCVPNGIDPENWSYNSQEK